MNQQLLRIDFQPTDKWRVTGRYMWNSDNQKQAYGTTWAGAGSNNLDDMGTNFIHPGRNWMLSTTGILSNTMSVELSVGSARNSLDYELENPKMTRTGAGLTAFPALYQDAINIDTIPDMRFNGGRVGGNAGYYQTNLHPFSNVNETYDAIANLTKIWGNHNTKFGVYFQHSLKAQSAFASHNTQISFIDSSSNPYDSNFGYANAALGIFNTFTQANKYARPDYVYTNVEWYGQDNWKVNSRLTVDYGVRFYALTPQWDKSLQVSTFLPDRWSASSAPPLYYPACIGAYPCSGSSRVGVDPANPANTVVERFIGRLVPPTTDAQRFNGTAQPGQDINDRLYSGTAFKISPRLGVVYDLTGEGKTIVRGGFGIFYDRPQGNTVFNTVLTPPSMLNPTLTWGTLQNLTASATDPYAPLGGMQPHGVRLHPTAGDGLERRRAAQADARHRSRPRLRRLQVGRPPGVRPDQRGARGGDVRGGEPGSHPDAELRAGRDGLDHRPPAPATRATAASSCGRTRPTATTTPSRRGSTAGSTTG